VTGIGHIHPDRQCARWHPLELIPWFRRFPPSVARDLAYTFIWNVGFAVLFTVFGVVFQPQAPLARMFAVNLLIANCVGYLIHGGYEVGDRLLRSWLQRASFGARALYYAAVPVISVFAGYWLAFTLLQWRSARQWVFSWQGVTSILLVSFLVSAVLSAVLYARERQARAEAALQAERARVESAERQFNLARLKLLEAQIEPHFLYNTLANVISLVDAQPDRAKYLVDRLIEYLRGAAVSARDDEVTLEREMKIVRAYLDLIRVRMGARLAYDIEVPAELAHSALPPMLLQPLVENAIKHGLEPKIEGGKVTIAARRENHDLVLTVVDDGVGVRNFGARNSTRMGLANVRERLAAMFGDRARLVLVDAAPGTVATLTLPLTHHG